MLKPDIIVYIFKQTHRPLNKCPFYPDLIVAQLFSPLILAEVSLIKTTRIPSGSSIVVFHRIQSLCHLSVPLSCPFVVYWFCAPISIVPNLKRQIADWCSNCVFVVHIHPIVEIKLHPWSIRMMQTADYRIVHVQDYMSCAGTITCTLRQPSHWHHTKALKREVNLESTNKFLSWIDP